MIEGEAGGDGNVSGVGPGRFGQSSGLPLAEEMVERVVVFEEWTDVIFGWAGGFDHSLCWTFQIVLLRK